MKENKKKSVTYIFGNKYLFLIFLIIAFGFVYSTRHTSVHWKGVNGAKMNSESLLNFFFLNLPYLKS